MFSNEDRPVPEKKEETGYKMKQIYLLDPHPPPPPLPNDYG